MVIRYPSNGTSRQTSIRVSRQSTRASVLALPSVQWSFRVVPYLPRNPCPCSAWVVHRYLRPVPFSPRLESRKRCSSQSFFHCSLVATSLTQPCSLPAPSSRRPDLRLRVEMKRDFSGDVRFCGCTWVSRKRMFQNFPLKFGCRIVLQARMKRGSSAPAVLNTGKLHCVLQGCWRTS